MGKLYVIATPIGNSRDITVRALDVLPAVSLVACEDTRTTRKLLRAHGIQPPRLISYTEHNRAARIPGLLSALAAADLALVSEAGMPGISDPGYELVAAAIAAGHDVVPIPGPSAVLAALAASGLPARRFMFVGFLPRKSGERRVELTRLSGLDATIVCFESPRRVRATIKDIIAALGDREMVAAREISKTHEEFIRGRAGDVLARLDSPRGEFTLVISAGPSAEAAHSQAPSASILSEHVADLRRRGHSTPEIAKELASTYGLSRREAYRAAVSGELTERS